jgi:hypothetical protein
MFDFIVGMLFGSLLTLVPVLVWDRLARSRAIASTPSASSKPENTALTRYNVIS